MSNTEANKRVAKNTLLLYSRMIILLLVSLYTSRIVLKALGFDDYGIYNVVGGVVTMFAFINAAMGNATSRFITFALGKGDKNHTIDVLNMSMFIHLLLALLIILLAETIGIWFLYNHMVIPESRFNAALWVYQLSVIASVATILCVPFNATIIAYEHMGAFAYLSILDAIFKLAIAFAISLAQSDRLILYALLYLIVNLINILIYQIYCFRKFDVVKFRKPRNYSILKPMLSFASWSLLGNLAYIGYTQGLNILLNVFFGPVVNASRGVAYQIQGAVKGFVTNFQMAVNPQITKSYAQEDFARLHSLIITSSKFSFYLLLCIILPVSLQIQHILQIWLADVPEYCAQFSILTMAVLLISTLSNPLGIANNATGKIRNYQLVEGGTLLLIVPVAYLVLKSGGNPVSVFWVQLVIMCIVQWLRVQLVCHKIRMSIKDYCIKVLFRVLSVAVCSSILSIIVAHVLPESILSMILIVLISVCSVIICSYFFGLSISEKNFIISKLSGFIGKHRNIA